MKKFIPALLSCTLALGLAAMGAVPALAYTGSYNDFEAITSHVDTTVSQKLAIRGPSGDSTTTSQAYYITGTSNPDSGLTCNGTPVENRGIFGSFGVYVALEKGSNTFTFAQDNGASQSVTITRSSGGGVVTTKVISQMFPSFDSAYDSGQTITLKCVAPSGAGVTAIIAGESVPLSQAAAAQKGVPATFTGSYTLPAASGTQKLGNVKYVLNGAGSYTASGALYAVGQGSTLLVEVKDTSVLVFDSATTTTGYTTIAKGGAVDYVSDQNDERYQLGMGGWVSKEGVAPLTTDALWKSKVSGVSFSKTQWGERYKFKTSAKVVATTWQNANTLHVELPHTSGISSIPTGESKLFSGATVTQKGDSTILDFALAPGASLWGYVVEYDEKNGITTLYCKYPAQLSGSGTQPLSGLIVGLDAGHGGSDTGAWGTSRMAGPVESDITRATAITVKKRLESLGATVILAPAQGDKTTTTQRLGPSEEGKADFYISLHCNSINGNGLKPNGVETYYYTAGSKAFATVLQKQMVAQTGRNARSVLQSYYKVTLNTYCPSAMIEMGFLTNPVDYDSLCSRRGMFNTANAIADGIIEYLS